MLRELACLAICLSVLLSGCERKEPEQAPPAVEVEAPAGKPPPEEVPIPGRQGLFIETQPVTIGEYVEYLRATAQPVPEAWEGMGPDAAGADRAVAGLSRDESELYAAWAMKRLPTPEEWAQAKEIVGARPYPWADGEPSEPQAVLHLVRDYQSGSPAEEQARQAKAELPMKLMEKYQQRIVEARAEMEAALETARTRRRELWQEVKPEFFSMMNEWKEAALRRARQRWQGDALDLLRELVLAKGRAAGRLVTEDLTTEEREQIVGEYDDTLAETLNRVQNIRQELEGATGDLQSEVVELTRKLEEAGQVGATEAERHAAGLLADAEQPVQTPREAHELVTELRSAAERLEATEPSLEGIPSLEQIRQKIADLQEELQKLSEAEPMPAEIEELQGRLQTIGETMERTFVKEEALLEELPALVDLRARKEAIQAQLSALEEALGRAATQQGEQQPAGTEE